MAVRKLKPTSAGRRFQTVSDFEEITRTTPEKSLTEGLTKKAGRNNHGRVTSRRRGGGVKRLYRIIDFKRNKLDIPATVALSSTTRTVPPASRCCTMPTVKNAISLHRWA